MRIPDVTAMLARTPETLTTLLVGLPEEWLHRNDGPQTWSAYDIVGHLLLADTVFGKGVSFMEGRIEWHYSPMSEDQYRDALVQLEAARA